MTRLRELIGATLRRHRHAQHRTLREVADTAGISLTYLSEIERGRKEPSSEVLAALSDALGLVLSEILREVADTLAGLEAARAASPVGFLPARRRPAPQPAAERTARVVDLHAQLLGRLTHPPADQPPAAPQPTPTPAAPATPAPTPQTARSSRRPTARILDFQAYAARRSA